MMFWPSALSRRFVEFDQAGAFAEAVGGQAGEEAAGAAGGKDVRRACEIIAGCDRRVRPDEDGAGVLDAGGIGAGIARA